MNDITNDAIDTAAKAYVERKARRVHPVGGLDKGGRWYPAAREVQECCRHVRTPSRTYPYSLLTHARSLAHVCALYGVPKTQELAVRRRARQIEKEMASGARAGAKGGE